MEEAKGTSTQLMAGESGSIMPGDARAGKEACMGTHSNGPP